MPLDAVCLHAVLSELDARIAGGRIEKVYQPDREEIVLQIRGGKGACKLLLSAAASAPRIHLIEQNRENPAVPDVLYVTAKAYSGRKNCVFDPAVFGTYGNFRIGYQ